MWWIIVAVILIVVTTVVSAYCVWKDNNDAMEGMLAGIIVFLVSLLIFGGLAVWGCHFTGLYDGVSEGERIGYVTKISKKGIIYKTNEVQIQVGTGDMAALQAPHPFSCDDETAARLTGMMGQKIRVHYSEWIIMPYSKGESGYWITGVELSE